MICVLLVSACVTTQAPVPPPPPLATERPAADGVPDAPAEALLNARITGIYAAPITLEDGQYQGAPFVPGGASRPTVTLLRELTAADFPDQPLEVTAAGELLRK